jgi:hypothetical protein
MLPYNQIGIIANREIINVGTADPKKHFTKTFGKFLDFFFPIANLILYI